MKRSINVFSSVQIYVGCFGYIFCHRAVRFALQCASVEIQTVGQGRMWVLHKLQSFVIILTLFHTAQITWQLDGAKYIKRCSHLRQRWHLIIWSGNQKDITTEIRPGYFLCMYSPPHAQRTPKISSIKNCALLLLYSLYRHFPKDIVQKYLWKMVGVCYI